jgi:hypothetical protein
MKTVMKIMSLDNIAQTCDIISVYPDVLTYFHEFWHKYRASREPTPSYLRTFEFTSIDVFMVTVQISEAGAAINVRS